MGACRFLYDNRWKDGTLTASSEKSTFPALNTRHRWLTKTWRATGKTAEWLKINRSMTSPGIQVVAIRYNNYSASATIKFEWNSSDAWGSPAGYVAPDLDNSIIVAFLDSVKGYQWWRHTVADVSNPLSYVEAGVIFIGPYFQPSRNRNYGEGEKEVDPSLLKKSEGGQISSVIRDPYKEKSISFSHLTDSDHAQFEAMFSAVGQHGGLFYVEDYEDPMNTSYYVRIAGHDWKFNFNNDWDLSLSMETQL